jgi:hypothetical protein
VGEEYFPAAAAIGVTGKNNVILVVVALLLSILIL